MSFVTTIRITDLNSSHARLSIWVNHALICSPGNICLRVEELQAFYNLLQPDRIEVDPKFSLQLGEYLTTK